MNKMILHPKAARSAALKTLKRLCALDLGKDVNESVREAYQRLALPLTEVLDKVPGTSVVDRCRCIGIARQTYYQWLRGTARPNPEQAEKLSKMTGYTVDQIRGRIKHGDENETEHAAAAAG